MSDGLVERLRRGHEPRTAQLDQDGGATGKVCIGHGMGYPPSWPCLYVEAADEIERLQRDLGEAFAVFAAAVTAVGGKVTIPDSYLLENWTLHRRQDFTNGAIVYETEPRRA